MLTGLLTATLHRKLSSNNRIAPIQFDLDAPANSLRLYYKFLWLALQISSRHFFTFYGKIITLRIQMRKKGRAFIEFELYTRRYPLKERKIYICTCATRDLFSSSDRNVHAKQRASIYRRVYICELYRIYARYMEWLVDGRDFIIHKATHRATSWTIPSCFDSDIEVGKLVRANMQITRPHSRESFENEDRLRENRFDNCTRCI